MKIFESVLVLAGLTSGVAFAGTAKFTGQGHISKPAEYVELSVVVKAECFKDLVGARDTANNAAQKVLALFRTIIDPNNPKDAAYTDGGQTQKSQGHYVSGTNTLICANTFEKTIRVSLLTTNLDQFQENFLTIENVIYAGLSGGRPNTEEPTIYAVLGVPVAHVFSETVETTERDALAAALKNAKREFSILAEAGCGIASYSIVRAVEPSNAENLPNPYAGTRGVPPPSNPNGAPVIFADIWITKALEVTFEFQGGTCGGTDRVAVE